MSARKVFQVLFRSASLSALIAALSCSALAEGIRSVPKATCGPQDRVESVQGQTTLAERFSSQPKVYNCNLELVGQFEGEGAGADVEAFDRCAYYSTAPNPEMKHPGVAVLDVSDSRRPKIATYLTSPAMINAHESLEISPQRRLLLGSNFATNGAATFDLYDISDCRRPVLKSSVSFPGDWVSHAGSFSADERTFYGARFDLTRPLVFALDVADPAYPRALASWTPPPDKKDWITHSALIDKTGTRLYVALKRMDDDSKQSAHPNGLAIFDVSAVQSRSVDAQFRLVSTLFWDDTHGAEGLARVRIKDRDYLVFSDNLGALGYERPISPDNCKSGKPSYGLARIIDVTDDVHPRVVAKLVSEVADPSNCSKSLHDPTLYGSYGSFACSVDDEQDGRLLACGNFEAGVRVFDIREPAQPREVAYYKPPARRTQDRPGSLFRVEPGQDHTADSVLVAPKFRRNATEIWFTSADNGFQVVRFSDRFKASNRDLFKE